MNKLIFLNSTEIPKNWYNILPDLPKPPAPYYNPMTKKIIGPDDLAPLFPMGLIEQEVSQDKFIKIPDEILDILSIWRPTPLVRATNLEKAIGTKSKIYFKNESVSPAGSHKPNTAVAQAYYNKKEGINRISTETGAGQWGSALSLACKLLDIELIVYMVKISFQQKPYRKNLMQVWGAECIPSPSDKTNIGRKILEKDPDCNGSLGIAISEAVEDAVSREDTHYSLGSVLNHVCMHQTIIGEEAIKQFEKVDDYPDVVIGCVGGGSNFAGLSFPFYREKKEKNLNTKIVAVEPTACPTVTKGLYQYDFGDTGQMAPIALMYTLGHDFVPSPIHAGGLRYHGMSPLVSLLAKEKEIEAFAYHQKEVFDAAVTFARSEGIVPAPETSHAIKSAIEEAKKADEEGVEKTILFNFSGHGHFDMGAYEAYFSGEMTDYAYPEEKIKAAMENLPKIESE